MMKSNTISEVWKSIKEYVNSLPIGGMIYRKKLLECTNETKQGNTHTDNHRLWLVHCGYLEKVKDGQYRILKHIDDDLTPNQLKKMAYSQELRINYDRYKKLNNILDENHNL